MSTATPVMLQQFSLIRKLRKSLVEPQRLYTGLFPDYEENSQLKIVSDTKQGIYRTANLIQTALMDCESKNPFEILGIDMSLIFSKNSPADESRIKMSIMKLMNEFSDRLNVTNLSVNTIPDRGEIELSMNIFYKPLNMEVNLSGLILGRG